MVLLGVETEVLWKKKGNRIEVVEELRMRMVCGTDKNGLDHRDNSCRSQMMQTGTAYFRVVQVLDCLAISQPLYYPRHEGMQSCCSLDL